MPTLRTPLFGSYNNRSFAAVADKDQFFKGCILTPIVNQQSRTAQYYVEKRTGAESSTTPSNGNLTLGLYCGTSSLTSTIYSVFVISNVAHIFSGTTDCGSLIVNSNGRCFFYEVTFNSITYLMISVETGTNTGTGWYLASDAVATTAYTADGNNSTTITDIKVAGVPSVSGLYVGQQLTAASNIVAGSRIVSINAGAFSAVLDTATTGGAFNDLAITKEPVAKIIDADFPTDIVGGFAEKDGYILIGTRSGRIYNSDLNTVSSWGASNYLSCTEYNDYGRGIVRNRELITAFGSSSIEHFYNAGNPSGSPFSSAGKALGAVDAVPANSSSVVTVSGKIYFISNSSNVMTMEGNEPVILGGLGLGINSTYMVRATPFIYKNKQYINVCINNGAGSIVNWWYCVNDKTVSEAGFGSVNAYASSDQYGGTYFTIGSIGKVLFVDDKNDSGSTFKDNGSAFTMSIQLATDMGTQDAKWPTELRVLADVQSSGNLAVSWSDDDGATYTTPRNITMTDIHEMRLTRLGMFKGARLWKFEHSDNTPCRIKMIEIDW